MEKEDIRQTYLALRREISKVIVGQDALVESVLVGLFSGGHVLLEGVPGLAKTLLSETLGRVLDFSFSRVQFTPDLLPSDITGSEIYRVETGEFAIKRGPVFTQILLADEINRAPSKVQSALLEAMQERTVTLAGETMELPFPFFVIATENPLDEDGTYPLPEASLDRFLLKVQVEYPNRDEELEIVRRMTEGVIETPNRCLTSMEFLAIRAGIEEMVFVDPKIIAYAVDLVRASRDPASVGLSDVEEYIAHGASPRASMALVRCAKTLAAFHGRDYILPDDIKYVAYDVLRHRIGLSLRALGAGVTPDLVIEKLLSSTPVV